MRTLNAAHNIAHTTIWVAAHSARFSHCLVPLLGRLARGAEFGAEGAHDAPHANTGSTWLALVGAARHALHKLACAGRAEVLSRSPLHGLPDPVEAKGFGNAITLRGFLGVAAPMVV